MTPKNKPNSKSKSKPTAGTLASKRKTPLPKTVSNQASPTMQAIAEQVARTYQGELLRYQLRDDVLVILFVDGRKHYVTVEQ